MNKQKLIALRDRLRDAGAIGLPHPVALRDLLDALIDGDDLSDVCACGHPRSCHKVESCKHPGGDCICCHYREDA